MGSYLLLVAISILMCLAGLQLFRVSKTLRSKWVDIMFIAATLPLGIVALMLALAFTDDARAAVIPGLGLGIPTFAFLLRSFEASIAANKSDGHASPEKQS